MLFLQHVIDALKAGGRCGMVIDEGVLFRTTESAFVQTKRKLLDETDLWCIVSLPPGVFSSAGAGREDEPALLHEGRPDRAHLVLRPLGRQGHQEAAADDGPFRRVLRAAGVPRGFRPSWTVTRAEIEARGYDLKAVNPTAKAAGRHAHAHSSSWTRSRRAAATSMRRLCGCVRCSGPNRVRDGGAAPGIPPDAARGATRSRGSSGNSAMLPRYVFDRRSGQRHGFPAAIPIHPAP